MSSNQSSNTKKRRLADDLPNHQQTNESLSNNSGSKRHSFKRSKFACERCKKSKRKCDGIPDLKSCSHCKKANVECSIVCSKEDTTKHVTMLEQQVRYLEDVVEKQQQQIRSFASQNGVTDLETKQHPISHSSDDFIKSASFLSYGRSERSFYGSLSGVNMAFILEKAVNPEASKSTADSSSNFEKSYQSLSSEDSNGKKPTAPLETATIDYSYIYTNEEFGSKLVSSFIAMLFPRFPIIPKSFINQLHLDRIEVLSSTSKDRRSKVNRFILLMVYSIGLKIEQLSGSAKGPNSSSSSLYSSAQLYHEATDKLEEITSILDRDSIMCLMLVAMYMLRSSQGQPIWHLLGLMIRFCIELGLHRKEPVPVPAEYLYESVMKRRVFWSVYVLERAVCMHFGRPYTLSDYDIDVDLPYNINDDITDANELNEIINLHPEKMNIKIVTDMSMMICLVKIRRIDSVIQHTVYRVDKDMTVYTLLNEISWLFEKVQAWRSEAPKLAEEHEIFIELLYHKTKRVLLVPLISRQIPSGPGSSQITQDVQRYINECVKSCGKVCLIAKKLIQFDWYSHSFIALHTLFVSAMTLVYCLLTDCVDWSFEISTSLQACSTALFVVGERIPATRAHLRDPFEKLLSKTVDQMNKKMKTHQSQSKDSNSYSDYRIAGINVLDTSNDFDGRLLGSMGVKNPGLRGEIGGLTLAPASGVFFPQHLPKQEILQSPKEDDRTESNTTSSPSATTSSSLFSDIHNGPLTNAQDLNYTDSVPSQQHPQPQPQQQEQQLQLHTGQDLSATPAGSQADYMTQAGVSNSVPPSTNSGEEDGVIFDELWQVISEQRPVNFDENVFGEIEFVIDSNFRATDP